MAETEPTADAMRRNPRYLCGQTWSMDFTGPTGRSVPAVRITLEISENLSMLVEEQLEKIFDDMTWRVSEILTR